MYMNEYHLACLDTSIVDKYFWEVALYFSWHRI